MTWLLFPVLVIAMPGIAITGRVYDATDSTPLYGAHVSVHGTDRGTATDSTGRFVIVGIDPAGLQLEASHVAYTPARTRVNRRQCRDINFLLQPRAITLAPVEVRPRVPTPPPGTVELTIDQVRHVPGAEKDLFRALQTLPGVASTGDYFGWLYVRGGVPSENLFLLDGLEIPNPYHFAGLASVFNNRLVDRVRFSTGGFGPDRGDRVASVLQVTTRPARTDRVHMLVGLDPVEIDGTIESMLPGNVGMLAAARHSYLGSLLRQIDFGTGYLQPGYTDLQVRLTRRWHNPALDLSAGLLRSAEHAVAGDSGGSRRLGLDLASDFWTAGVNLSWQPHARIRIRSTLSALDSRQEFKVRDAFGTHERHHHPRKRGFVIDARCLVTDQTVVRAGASLGAVDYSHHSTLPMELIDPSRWGDTATARVSFNQGGGFVELVHDPGIIRLAAGLRVDARSLGDPVVASPRLNAVVRLGTDTRLHAAWGIYRQFAAPEYVAPDSLGLPGLDPSRSRHIVVGFNHRLPADVEARVELYDKNLTNVVVVENRVAGDTTPMYTVSTSGTGRARGIELTLSGSGDRLSWRISYAFSRARRSWLHGIKPTPADGEQPHILNLTGAIKLPAAFDASARLRWAAGAPYTPETHYYENHCIPGDHNSARYPDYFRLDLRLARRFRFGRHRLEAYASVLNVTCAGNVQSYYYDSTGERKTIYMMPLLPLVGIEFGF